MIELPLAGLPVPFAPPGLAQPLHKTGWLKSGDGERRRSKAEREQRRRKRRQRAQR